MTNYGKCFTEWRKVAGQEWHDYTHHEFVEGIRLGTLPQPAFMNYLVQDYMFLINFSRAWAFAVVKAGTLEEMQACSRTVDTLLQTELGALHTEICAKAGLTPEALAEVEEAVPNVAYTRYVLDSGLSGDFLDLLAALAPCVLGYGEIGLRLARDSAPDNPYAEWIATYAGAAYQASCVEVGHLLDSAVARRLGDHAQATPRWTELSKRFTMATRLEVGFWGLGRE